MRHMGTWDTGPFDNDTAADWCGGLSDADPDERAEMVRTALAAAADERGYLDADEACEAVAAAAILASTRPGGEAITSAYAPDFLLDGGSVDLPDELVPLAVRALDRIMADESEWRDLWADADTASRDAAFTGLAHLRTALITP
jgi:hypothetical protein